MQAAGVKQTPAKEAAQVKASEKKQAPEIPDVKRYLKGIAMGDVEAVANHLRQGDYGGRESVEARARGYAELRAIALGGTLDLKENQPPPAEPVV